MKNLSVKLKITIWFSVIMLIIIAATFGIIMWVSNSVMQKNIQDNVVETVEDNVDEIEFLNVLKDDQFDNDSDLYISYKDGYLEIDDDFLETVNGVYTALYHESGVLLYGENPVALESNNVLFSNGRIQKLKLDGVTYYVYDRLLDVAGTQGLWLRGIVSENQGTQQLTSIIRLSLVILPALFVLAVIGGYWIAGRMLKPLEKITEAAVQIGQGSDLDRRIDLGAGRDEIHRLAGVFDDMFGRLDKAFKAERQFTSDASHELRTPMAVIMAQCEFILEAPRTQEEYEEALHVVQRQGRKMSRLIEDMLCFSRMEQNSDNYPKQMINFSELTNDVCTDMAMLREKDIHLTWTAAPDIFIFGNQILLTRLLTNLISNAYRYGRNNGFIKVILDCGEEIQLTVEDDGIGIEENQQDKIFERFYRTDASRTTEGTGLGLAMVKDIAQYHGGRVLVTSEIGKGSIFVAIFPCVEKK